MCLEHGREAATCSWWTTLGALLKKKAGPGILPLWSLEMRSR